MSDTHADERERQTRKRRIDPRLEALGWSVAPADRPRTLNPEAITEYETDAGPADYALSVDGRVLGVVEAKRLTIGPQDSLTQAERYSRGVTGNPFNFDGFHVPFLYSTNGEVIWFHDVRHPMNRSRRITDFHTPQAPRGLLDREVDVGYWCGYRKYGDDLVLFDLVNAVTASVTEEEAAISPPRTITYKTISETLEQLTGELKDRFEAVKAFLLALGDDVQMKTLKYYLAFKRIKNFACVEVRTQESKLLAYAKLDPTSVPLEEGFTRDVREIGHYGTGDLEIVVRSMDDFERAKPLLIESYEGS